MKLGLPISISVLLWYLIGIVRFVYELFWRSNPLTKSTLQQQVKSVAICLPAHNEELVVLRTISSLKKIVPPEQIYVVSDGSIDRTAQIARFQNCQVLELNPGGGKAKALVALIKHFRILGRHEFVLFVDADTIIDRHYLRNALPVFLSHPRVVAIAGYVKTDWRRFKKLSWRRFVVAYRVRLNILLQLLLTYGQTWQYTNTVSVIPGSCSIYRASVLKKLRIDTPGLLIEDFNLAFQIHKNKLGLIYHHPRIFSLDQDPDNLRDYWRQVRRWNVGFFQTVRKHGLWPSFFWVFLGLFIVEVLSYSLFMIVLPLLVLLLTVQYYAPIINPQIVTVSIWVSQNYLTLWGILAVVVVIDYLLTLLVAITNKNWQLLIYGLGFIFFGFLNALILVTSIPKGLLTKSAGRWISPTRR